MGSPDPVASLRMVLKGSGLASKLRLMMATTHQDAGISGEGYPERDLQLPRGSTAAVLGLVLAIIAQSLLPGSLTLAAVAVAVAAVVLQVSAGPLMEREPLQGVRRSAMHGAQSRFIGAGICAGLLVLTVGLYAFDAPPAVVVSFWVAGLASAVIAAWRIDRQAGGPESPSPAWTALHFQLLAGVVLVAAMLRFWAIGDFPGVYEDEGAMLVDATRVIDGAIKTPFESLIWSEGAFYVYPLAGLLQLGVEPGLALKLMAILPGIVTVGVLYCLLRELFDGPIAFFGAGFLAVSSWHLIISRWGYAFSFDIMLVTLMLLFLVRGLRSGLRLDFVFAGLAMGFAMSLSKSTLPVAGIVAAAALYCLVRYGPRTAIKLRGEHALILVLAALLVFAPRAYYIAEDPDRALLRPREVFLFDDSLLADVKKEPLRQTFTNARELVLSINAESGSAPRWVIHPRQPTVDLITGGLLMLGLAYALWNVRRWPYLLFIAVLLAVLAPASTAVNTDDRPTTYRLAATAPILAALASLPLLVLYRMQSSDRGRLMAVAGGCVVLAAATVLNLQDYFGDYRQSNRVFYNSGQVETRVARKIVEFDENYQVYLTNSQVYEPVVRSLTKGRATYSPVNTDAEAIATTANRRPLAFVLVTRGKWSDEQTGDRLLRRLQILYPGGRTVTGAVDREGVPFATIFLVDRPQ